MLDQLTDFSLPGRISTLYFTVLGDLPTNLIFVKIKYIKNHSIVDFEIAISVKP